MSFLDVRTVLVLQTVLHAACALVLVLLWRQNRERFAGLSLWVADYALLVVAPALMALRGRIPDWASITLAAPLIILGTALLLIGLERFFGLPGGRPHTFALPALYFGAHAYFAHVRPDLTARGLLFSLALLLLSLQGAWLLKRRIALSQRPAASATALVFAGFAVVNALRIVLLLAGPGAGDDFFKSGTADTLMFVSYLALLLMLTFSLALLVNARLIAERVAVERRLQEQHDEMERFVYSVSHDLKSPVITVTTYLGFLERDLERQDAEGVRGDLRFMRTAAERMGRMLEELLALSRLGRVTNAASRVTFPELVDEALGLVAGRLAERRVAVRVTGPPLVLHGDRARLVAIWQNLIDNAAKFMGSQPAPSVEIGVEQRDGEMAFFVRDNGVGIEPSFGARAFELFAKLDSGGEGTGLGLALVKRIVELHGGWIRVEPSGPGGGACFRFTLPEALAEHQPERKG